MRTLAVLLAICATAALVYSLAKSDYLPILIVLLVEAGVTRWLSTRANEVVCISHRQRRRPHSFRENSSALEDERYSSPRLQSYIAKLKRTVTRIARDSPSRATSSTGRTAVESLLGKIGGAAFSLHNSAGLAAEAWRRRWGGKCATGLKSFPKWKRCFRSHHIPTSIPQIHSRNLFSKKNHKRFFDGAELGHPLIPSAKCVRNSIRLDQSQRLATNQRLQYVRKKHIPAHGRNQYGSGDGRRSRPRDITSPHAARHRHTHSQHGLATRRPLQFFHGNFADTPGF